jgi:putative pyruvate formate lyase activating enzyme
MKFIAQSLSPDSYVNIMSQYRPCGRAAEINGLNSNLKTDEYHLAVQAAKEEGITRLDRPQRAFAFR